MQPKNFEVLHSEAHPPSASDGEFVVKSTFGGHIAAPLVPGHSWLISARYDIH